MWEADGEHAIHAECKQNVRRYKAVPQFSKLKELTGCRRHGIKLHNYPSIGEVGEPTTQKIVDEGVQKENKGLRDAQGHRIEVVASEGPVFEEDVERHDVGEYPECKQQWRYKEAETGHNCDKELDVDVTEVSGICHGGIQVGGVMEIRTFPV